MTPSQLTYSASAAAKDFQWLRPPQNCSIWAPTNFSPDNVIEIGSCREGKAYGKVVFKSGGTTQAHYFYDGLLASSAGSDPQYKEKCFERIKTDRPRLRAVPDSWEPLMYVGDISRLPDNELVSKFGAGTTIWIRINEGGTYSILNPRFSLCDEDHDLRGKGTDSVPTFGDIGRILVLIQNASRFEDVPAAILQHLTASVLQLTHEKFRASDGGISRDRFRHTRVDLMDENLSHTYASVQLTTSSADGRLSIEGIKNYVQEAQAAERARQQEAERRLQIKAKFDDFLKQTGSSALVRADDLHSNPFRYEGINIVILARYGMMLDANTSIFGLENGLLAVSGLDPRHSMRNRTEVVLAGKVTGTRQVPTSFGGSITAPLLSLRGIHVCQIDGCKDIIPN